MPKIVPLLALLLLAAGCGGGRSTVPSARGGRGTIRVAWPKADARLIPGAARSVVVVAILGGQTVGRATVARPATAAILTGLPYGTLALEIRAYPSTDGTGVAQAEGAGSMAVAEDAPGSAAVSMGSTVVGLSLAPAPANVPVGGTLAILASAKDRDGATVLLESGGLRERLDWSVLPAGLATLAGDGPTATLTGATVGDATVTARLKVKDDGTTVEAALPVKVARPAAGLATAGWPARGGDYGGAFAGRGSLASGTFGASFAVGEFRATPTLVVGPDGTLYTGSDTKVAARGAASWEVANAAGDVCRHLALTQGGVLLAATDQGLFARDAATGGLIWTFPSGVTALVVGRDGTVYARADKLYALDGATGAVRWTAPKANVQAVGDDGTLYGVASTSTKTGINTVVTQHDLRAWDPSNGAQRWSVPLGQSSSGGTTTTTFGSSAPTYAAGFVVVKTNRFDRSPLGRTSNGRVFAFRASDGGQAWSYSFATDSFNPVTQTGGAVAVRGGRVFAQWNKRAVALDAATGTKRWDVPGGEWGGVATASDGSVYLVLRPGTLSIGLQSLDPATGATRWRTETSGAIAGDALALADDGAVYIPASDGRIYPVR